MQSLYIIRREDLIAFGCPLCGVPNLSWHFSFGSCELCECKECSCKCATVISSLDELLKVKLRDTRIVSLISGHPFSRGSDSIIITQKYSLFPENIVVGAN